MNTIISRWTAIGLLHLLFLVILALFARLESVSASVLGSPPNPTPFLIKDLNTSGVGSNPGSKVIVNGAAYFAAYDGIHGTELWRSDGTSAGTWLVKDILTGTGSTTPDNLVGVNSQLFFTANDGVNGTELWVSDGTAGGTTLVKDIRPGSLNAGIQYTTAVSDTVFFSADDGTGNKLWTSDGTVSGTLALPYFEPSNLFAWNGLLFFDAYDSGLSNYGLYETDGTPEGTVFLGAYSSLDPPSGLASVDDTLFFKAYRDASENGLWRSDGTLTGTVWITNVQAVNLTALNHNLYFTAPAGDGSTNLGQSNGTLTGTTVITSLPAITNLTPITDELYFIGVQGALWKSDGTLTGTVIIKDDFDFSWCTGYPPCGVFNLTDFNGQLFWVSSDGSSHGAELWKSNGTLTGTVPVADIWPGAESSFPSGLVNLS